VLHETGVKDTRPEHAAGETLLASKRNAQAQKVSEHQTKNNDLVEEQRRNRENGKNREGKYPTREYYLREKVEKQMGEMGSKRIKIAQKIGKMKKH